MDEGMFMVILLLLSCVIMIVLALPIFKLFLYIIFGALDGLYGRDWDGEKMPQSLKWVLGFCGIMSLLCCYLLSWGSLIKREKTGFL